MPSETLTNSNQPNCRANDGTSSTRVIVIGAGAAGLMAAAQAAKRGASVVLLEKNSKTGVKILMSGGTRCNLTHNTDARGITEGFGHARRFLQSSVGRFTPAEVVAMFNDAGVETKVEDTGKIFPTSNRAVQVRDALHQLAIESGVQILLRHPVRDVRRDDQSNRFEVLTDDHTFIGDAVIVTAGGRSWPGCGTTGDAYAWLKKFGHTIVPTRPALVPLVGGQPWMQKLSGITIDDCIATVRERNVNGEVKQGRKSILSARRSSLLMTHFGLSGPAAMDVSGVMTAAESMNHVQLEIDLLPQHQERDLEASLLRSDHARRGLTKHISGWLPQRLAEAIAANSTEFDQDTKLAELPQKSRRRLLNSLKRLAIPITGTRGFEKAEVTAGGVKLSEVDPRTMQSKLQQSLFIAGEVLDVDGWIGGYNFQAAFSTGHAAGNAVSSG